MFVAIVDYGMSNLKSVFNAVDYVTSDNSKVKITNNYKDIDEADRIIFPGQGAINDCMTLLKQKNLVPSLRKAIDEKPFLGICLGLQSLFEFSYEGEVECLSLLKGRVHSFKNLLFEAMPNSYKVPHMGWNKIKLNKKSNLLNGIDQTKNRFYFLHSYVLSLSKEITIATSEYNIVFPTIIQKNNIYGIQCHPEKSHDDGLKILENFSNL